MKLMNPLQMNDWPIKSFLGIILSVQIFFLGLIVLDVINIQIPLLRELTAFMLLTFVPGILILRILKIHNIGSVKTLLYSVGLSIGTLMLIGLFMNMIYPFFGVSKPFSFLSLYFTLNLIILSLCIIVYVIDKKFSNPDYVDLNEILSPYFLILCFIPFLSIFGTYILNQYGNNYLQMFLILIIAIFPLITLKWVPKKLYPFVIFVLSLSLLFHTSLLSSYIWGADITTELLTSTSVLKNGLWYPSIEGDVNAMLSVVFLAPIYSIMTNLSIAWCFKIIYSILFSLIPVGLFVVYNRMKDKEIAFLACIFFISVNAYFTTLPSAARQEIAELFLALLIMIIVDEKIKGYSKSILLVLFGFSLVISHYGVSYIFLLIIGVALLIVLLFNWLPTPIQTINKGFKGFKNFKVMNTVFPLFILCFSLAWFMYVANSSIFENAGMLGLSMINSITDVLNPETSQGYYLMKSTMPIFQSMERYLYLISELFIGIGILGLLFDNNTKNSFEFKIFSIASFFVLLMGIFLPYFAGAMNTDRLFHINLFFLSIYFVTGALILCKILNTILRKFIGQRSIKLTTKTALYALCVFLMIFSILNTGFLYQIFDQPKTGRFALDSNSDFYMVNSQEITATDWIKGNKDSQTKIYSDIYKSAIMKSLIYDGLLWEGDYNPIYKTYELENRTINNKTVLKDSYVFLGTFNINNNKLFVHGTKSREYFYVDSTDFQFKNLKIYDNGYSMILKGYGS